jgi:hypothetical protein
VTGVERRRTTPRWVPDDGGRTEAGFKGKAGDCVTRAIAIATGLGYRQVHDLVDGTGRGAPIWRADLSYTSADAGVHPAIVDEVLSGELGWWDYHRFRPSTRFVLSRLPAGRIIVELDSIPPHLCAVIDRVIHDIEDCSKGGRATVHGYWTLKPPAVLTALADP